MTPEQTIAALTRLITGGEWNKDNVEAIWGGEVTDDELHLSYLMLKPLFKKPKKLI